MTQLNALYNLLNILTFTAPNHFLRFVPIKVTMKNVSTSNNIVQTFLINVFKRLQQMLESDDFLGTVVIFSKVNCLNSMKAKMLLRDLDIAYIDVSLDKEIEVSKSTFF